MQRPQNSCRIDYLPATNCIPLSVLFAVIMAASTLNSVAPHMVTFSRAATAAGELFELIDRESSIDPFDDSGDIPLTTMGSIELDGVVFSYPTRPSIRVLDGYSLSVPAGKVTALVVSIQVSSFVCYILSNIHREPAAPAKAQSLDFLNDGITRAPARSDLMARRSKTSISSGSAPTCVLCNRNLSCSTVPCLRTYPMA